MTVLCDREIAELCQGDHPMISPFLPEQDRFYPDGSKKISAGLSSFGYDLRVGFEFKIFSNLNPTIVDPKNFDERSFVSYTAEKEGERVIIPPNSFILAHSLEHIHMPDDVVGVVLGKSTIARSGINTLCTPLEPGWEGYVTLEFCNTTPLPAAIYAGEGSCQVMFYRGSKPNVTYANRGGKYMSQGRQVVFPRL